MASCASGRRAAAASTSRMSAVPARASRPERAPGRWRPRAATGARALRARARRPGSTVPERVAMTRPSSGVKPMVVSTLRPSSTAASEAPAPRWQVMIRRPASGRPSSSRGAAGAVGVGQAVEAVAADAVALAATRAGSRRSRRPPGWWRGTRCRSWRRRARRAARGDRVERGQGLGLVQRREVGQVAQLLPHGVVDPDRAGEQAARRARCGGRPTSGVAPAAQDRRPGRRYRTRPARRAGRRCCSTASWPSSRRSLRLEDPALTTSTRTVSPASAARSSR